MAERKHPETPFGASLRRIAKGKQLSSLQVPVLEDAADLIDELEAREAAREATPPVSMAEARRRSIQILEQAERKREEATEADAAPPAGETVRERIAEQLEEIANNFQIDPRQPLRELAAALRGERE